MTQSSRRNERETTRRIIPNARWAANVLRGKDLPAGHDHSLVDRACSGRFGVRPGEGCGGLCDSRAIVKDLSPVGKFDSGKRRFTVTRAILRGVGRSRHITMKILNSVLIAAVAAFALTGCATTKQAKKVETTGFLPDYSVLEPGGEGRALLVYRNPSADFSKYDKVIIDRVTIWKSDGSSLDKVDPADLRRLALDLHYAIKGKLADDYTVVDAAGPGTLRVQVALTEAGQSNAAMDVFSTILPQARVLSAGKSMATGTEAFVGGAAAEAAISDAETGELLLAGVDKRTGGKSLKGSTDPWSDVHFAFEYWAQRMKERLAEERAKGQ